MVLARISKMTDVESLTMKVSDKLPYQSYLIIIFLVNVRFMKMLTNHKRSNKKNLKKEKARE